MSFGEKKIVFIDDNFLIRQAVKSAIYSFVDENIQIYSSDNGIEGLGYIFAVKPNIIIVDSTLPKYSGLEVVEYIEKNQTLQANNSLIIVLNDSFRKSDLLPKNFIVVNKDTKDFIKNLASIIYSNLEDREGLVSDFKTAKEQFKGIKSLKALVLERIIEISNKKDTLHQKDYSSDFMMYIGYVRAFIHNIFSQFLFFFFSFFYREHVDASVAQKNKDIAGFRTRYYPAFFLTTFTIFFFISQLIILFVGGITIGSYRINSVFSQSLHNEALVMNSNTSILFNYDAEVIEFRSEGVRLRALQREINGDADLNILGASTSSGEVTPTDILEPSPTIELQTETYFSTDNPFLTLKQPILYSEIESINMVGSTPAGTDIRFQLSPDGVRWFYYQEGTGWEETHQDYVSSNDIDTLNENLNKYQRLAIANTLYIKVFLHSNGEVTPTISLIDVVRVEELLANTEDNLVINEDIEILTVNVEQEQIVNLAKVHILNAAYANGNKIIQGRVDLPEGIVAGSGGLTDINVNIYFGEKDSLIGTTELVGIDKFGEKQYVFELITPSIPGGFVSAQLEFEGEISELSKLVENSTFTVNESGDQADFSAGDGSCDYDNVTPGSQCTLRAAIQEANALGGSDNIDFNIPTTDPGYRDYDTPDTSSSGDSTGGDDYWTIRPAALPIISESTIINGSTQTINQGDLNIYGPEIEIKAQFTLNAQNIAINSLVINGQTVGEYAITSAVDISGFTLTSSYLGVDVKSLSDATSASQGIRYAAGLSTNITIGNDTSDGNVIAGFGGGIAWTCDGTGTQTISIRGNRIGIGHTGNAIGNTAHGIALSGGCVVDIGGPDSVHRNYLGGNVRGISLDSSFVKEALITVRNNYFGTDLTGNGNRGNTSGIRMDSAGILFTLPDNKIIVGGAPGEGNLFRFNASEGLRIEANKAFEASYNTFSDNGRGITVGSDTAPTYEQVRGEIYNNHIGSSLNDPYFGLNVGGNASYGIYNRSSSPIIKGNNIIGNIRNGILNITTVSQSRINNQTQYISRPQIGGVAPFSGSLCNGTENNCIVGNIWSGISSFETVPTNESTLFSDNDFSTGNGSGNNRNIEQVWYGLFEIFSGTSRRTDLSGTVVAFPSNTQVRTTDDPSTIVTSGTTTNLTCLNGGGVGCPAAGHTTGTVDNTQVVAPVGALLSNETTWYRVVEYVVDSTGNTINYDEFKFENPHQISSTFTFDGDSTNNVVSTGAARVLNSQNYTDRGEPWTDKPLAVRDTSSNDFGRFQIMEIELVDANPIWNGSEWVITVDSTSDEDNVSTCGFDDGDGAYSGGGCGGPGGLPNGLTSLREAILVANIFTHPVTIEFNIPTSDSGYRDYDSPNVASSGDGADGDDYWTIRPATALPFITKIGTDIDGASQTTNIGDTNIFGPEIELDGINTVGFTWGILFNGAGQNDVNGLVVNNFDNPSVTGFYLYKSNNSTITNCYVGTDVKGITSKLNGHGININGSSNVTISENLISGNNNKGIWVIDQFAGEISDNVIIENNYIGVNRDGSAGLSNFVGITIETFFNNNSDNVTIRNNVISGNQWAGIHSELRVGEFDGIHIEGNLIGVDATGLNAIPNLTNGGIYLRKGKNITVGGDDIADRNIIAGNDAYNIIITSDAQDMTLKNNYIGVGISGLSAPVGTPGTSHGVFILENTHDVSITENVISGNPVHGIMTHGRTDLTTEEMIISNNRIGYNANNQLLPNGLYSINFTDTPVVSTHHAEVSNNMIAAVDDAIFIDKDISSFINIRDNVITSQNGIGINLQNTLEDVNSVNPNDVGDVDSGPNNYQNYPIIDSVVYLGAGSYTIIGDLDENNSEAPFDVEICEAQSNFECLSTLSHITVNSPWSETITLDGSNGIDAVYFSTLASNVNGQTSEFGAIFLADSSNLDYTILQYPVSLVSPLGTTIDDLTPLLDWNPSQFNGSLNPDVDHYDVYLDGVLIGTVNGSTTQLQINSPLSIGKHSWQVIAVRAGNVETGRSTTETFNIVEPNYNFGGIYPVGVTIDNGSPLFTWGVLAEADEYDFYLNGVLVEQGLTNTQFQWPLDNPLAEGDYTWFVVAIRIEPDGSRTEIGRTDVLSFSIGAGVVTTPPVTLTVTPTPKDISTGDDDPIVRPDISRIIQFTPFITTGAIGVALSVSLGVPGAILQIIGFLIGLPPKKKKYWGVVFDIENYDPIPFAVIRLINSQGKQVEQTTTNVEGKYSLNMVETGSYNLQVGASGYSQVMNTIEIVKEIDIIEDIELSREGKDNFLNKFIYHNRRRLFEYCRYFVFILMVFGLIYTIYAISISPIFINALFLFGYFIVILMHIVQYIRKKATLKTLDKKSGRGVSQASVRIYQQGKQVDLGVTDRNGNLHINTRDGQYEILAVANGYDKYLEERMVDYLGKDLEIKLTQVEGSKFKLN